MDIFESKLQIGCIILLTILILLTSVSAQDVNDKFQCYFTDEQEIDLMSSHHGNDKYMIIGENEDTGRAITSFKICKSLDEQTEMGESSPVAYVIYDIDCFQSGMELLSSITSADIVDDDSSEAARCRVSKREILSRPPTENVTSVTGITAVTSAAPPISELLHLQVLDETGYPVDEVITYQSVRLRVQALTTPEYQAPFVDRCWYSVYNKTQNKTAPYDDIIFMKYGCSLREPVLLESRDPVFDRNGILEAQTLLFDLLSVYDLEFEYMSFQCEVDLCTQKQYCRDFCPADGNMYRVPPKETIKGNVTVTVRVEKILTTSSTPSTTTKSKLKEKTDNPYIIKHTERPPALKVRKSSMEKAQPYLIVACIVIGCLVLLLLCYMAFRILSPANQEPGAGNPLEPGKQNYHGSLSETAVSGRGPYGGMKMYGTSPPPAYNPSTPFRGRLASTPGHVTQPLLPPSPSRGRFALPQQTELVLSPSRLSDLPSRYQDALSNGTVLGGEYYPLRDRQDVRHPGTLVGRELYYLPDRQLEQTRDGLLRRDEFRDPVNVDKRAIGGLLAREAAMRQGLGPKRELFSTSTERETQRQSEVVNLINKSLSEYIDRHGVEGLSSVGQN